MQNIDNEQCEEGTEQPYVPYTDVVCYFAIELKNLDFLEQTIQRLAPQAQYLLTCEIAAGVHKHSNGEHIHCYWRVPKGESDGYDAIRNAVKRKFNLVSAGKGKANSNQYGKVKDLRSAERARIYMMKDQNDLNKDMVRTNYADKDDLLQYMLLSYKKHKNQEKWAKLRAFAHNLMKKYKEEIEQEIETDNAPNSIYYNGPKNPYSGAIRKHILGKCNEFYRTINDGIPLAKNTLIRLSFELGLLDDETYVYNQLKFIMFS